MHVRQIVGEPPRRWFSSDDFDLIVWYESPEIPVGFQLCYDLGREEKALNWKAPAVFSHAGVDTGEGRSFRQKGAAMLVPDGKFDAARVRELFFRQSRDLPPEITMLILEKIDLHESAR